MSRIASSLPNGQSNFRSKPAVKRRKGLRRAGNKVKQWDAIRRVLKKRFLTAGITVCEVNEPGCFRDNWLGFAHTDKRRFLTPSELYIAILACFFCHSHLECLSRAEMKKAVLKIIAARDRQP